LRKLSIKIFAEKEMEQKIMAQTEMTKRKKTDEEKEAAKAKKKARVEAEQAWEVSFVIGGVMRCRENGVCLSGN